MGTDGSISQADEKPPYIGRLFFLFFVPFPAPGGLPT